MRLATWNLNNRVGKVPFRLEAAYAAVALAADVIVFTEYYPQQYHQRFIQILADCGWVHQLHSLESSEIANRTLIASRLQLEPDGVKLPDFDRQFPVNIVAAHVPALGLGVIGLRVPAYKPPQRTLLLKSWEWLECVAGQLRETPAVILGDLNVRAFTRRAESVAAFNRILDNGWQRAAPANGNSFFGRSGRRSEIDHVLVTRWFSVRNAEYVVAVPGFTLAGTSDALSDHAALVAELDISDLGDVEAMCRLESTKRAKI